MMFTWVIPVQANDELQSTEDITGLIQDYQGTIDELVGNMDESTVSEAFSFLEEKVADGSFESEEGLREAIAEGQERFGFEISEEQARDVLGMVTALEDMGFDSESIINNIESMYNEYGSDITEHTEEIVVEAVKESAGTIIKNAILDFFAMIGEAVKNFFENLF
ncbi:MAG: DUF1002 domain-containing protein [Lachnospiraceae bacterium]|nr:DUF1002 domain-containing protein [Lachnospiraceae bacterium]